MKIVLISPPLIQKFNPMIKLSKESRITFTCLMLIPFIWITLSELGLLEKLKTKSLDWRMIFRGEIPQSIHSDSKSMITVEGNKTVPVVPRLTYVNFDAATLAMDGVGERPWDRAFFRDTALALLERGDARVLGFDFGFTPKSMSKMVPEENSFRSDAAIGELIEKYPDRVVLGCLYSGVPTPFVKPTRESAFPPLFKDGFSMEASLKSEKFHYPESPTYPLLTYKNDKYLGRKGSFTVPPFRAVDAVPRWVPLWFPSRGKAHAYNLLGGKQSKLKFELPRDNEIQLSNLRKVVTAISEKMEGIEKLMSTKNDELKSIEKKKSYLSEKIAKLEIRQTKVEEMDQAIKNFSSTLSDNPSLSAIVQPQIDQRIKERNEILSIYLAPDIDSEIGSEERTRIANEIAELQQVMGNFELTLSQNPSLSAVIKPQIEARSKEMQLLVSKLTKFSEAMPKSLSAEQLKVSRSNLSLSLSTVRTKYDQLQSLLAEKNLEISEIHSRLSESKLEFQEVSRRKLRLEGNSETEIIEGNNTLRLIYAREPGDASLGNLVDSLPNEVPLYRNRRVFTLGVESLLAYYGVDENAVQITDDGNQFAIMDRDGAKIIDCSLTEKQFLEVNWFSKWTEELKEKNLMMAAKRAYAEENYDMYLENIPSIFITFLNRVEGLTVSKNSDLIEKMQNLGLEEELIDYSKRLLAAPEKKDEIPSFDQLSQVVQGIAYYFMPPTLESKFNPMCGMRDVLQNAKFQDQVRNTIVSLEDKLASLKGPKYLGMIESALDKNPENDDLKEKKKAIQEAIVTNSRNLVDQKEELSRINAFFACFKDSIVLLGPEEKTFQDLAPTPFDSASVPKVGVHGNLIKTLTTGEFLTRLPKDVDHAATVVICIIMALLAVYQGNKASLVQAGGLVLLAGYVLFCFITFSKTHVVWPVTTPLCSGLSTSFIGLAAMVVIEQKAKGRLKGMFGSYVSSELVDQMVNSGEEPSLGGEETQITAFFSDVQAFSSFSELLTPTGLVELMNDYLSAMTEILQEEKGTLDKYIGDAIVAMYGAPIPMNDHAYQSVKTAIRMQKKQIELREKWKSEGDKWPDIVAKMQTRIGCNTGTATVGNMGAKDRFNYTMMGDMVNLAARCESGAKAYGAYIMVTEETKLESQYTQDDIAFRYLDKIVVKGRKQPVAMFEPTGFMKELNQETQDCLDCFSQGINKYLAQDWEGALKMFEKAKAMEPNKPGVTPGVKDNPSMILIDRVKTMRENPPGDDWDGVYVMTSK